MAVTVTAAAIDVRTRRIPNVVTFGAALLGLALAAAGVTDLTVARSLGGLALGFALFLPGHLFGGTGAGDVKLMAAVGAIVGPHRVLPAFLFSVLAGGLIAAVVATARGRLVGTIGRTARLAWFGSSMRDEIEASSGNSFPFGPAIALGSVVAVLADLT